MLERRWHTAGWSGSAPSSPCPHRPRGRTRSKIVTARSRCRRYVRPMATTRASRTTSPMIEALHADGPDPEYADRLMLFGRLVGSWDIEGRFLDERGNVVRETR